MKSFILPAIALLASASVAQQPTATAPTRVEIGLSNFKFSPSTITLQHGQSYVLHFANTATGGHDFTAKEFFAAATVAPEDRATVAKGEIELGGGESADVHLIAPAPGTYKARCTHFMHSAFGMTGSIVVQ